MAFAATWVDLEIIMLSEVRQRDTNLICYHLYVESKKKKDSQILKILWFPKETGCRGGEGWAWVGYGNVAKLDCDDGCAIRNILKFME